MDILEVLDSTFPDTLLQGCWPLRKTGIMIKTLWADVTPMLQTLEGVRGYSGVNKGCRRLTGDVVFQMRCFVTMICLFYKKTFSLRGYVIFTRRYCIFKRDVFVKRKCYLYKKMLLTDPV